MNRIDKVISYFSPSLGLKRSQARIATDAIRNYDVASRGRRNEGWYRPNTTAADELSKAFQIGAASAQELCRNNPLAGKIKRIWSGNIVGAGIQLDIKGDNDIKVGLFQKDYDLWCNSTTCDYEGHYNLYGLQWLWANTIVESGAVFILKRINSSMKIPLQLQTLEQSQLDRGKNGEYIRDGIEYTNNGAIKGYWFIIDKTQRITESKFYPASAVLHVFRKERVGQHLGMTWLAPIATLLRNYDTYMDAKLMQQQIAACFAVIVENASSNLGSISPDNQLPDTIESGMIEYVDSGTIPHTISPPKADNSSQFDDSIKGDIAAGVGLTREQLTGDFSKVNFASGRMAKNEFNYDLDYVQKVMFKPALEGVFNWVSSLYQIKNGVGDYTSDWTFPTRSAVNPKEEFEVLMSKVRHSMMSPSKAAKLSGEKLDVIVKQWVKDKELFGDLVFDIDPSLYAATGNQLNNNDAASANNDNQGVK